MQRTFSKSGIYSNSVVMYKPIGNDRIVLGEPLEEVLIPSSLAARWRDFAVGLADAVNLRPHIHEGRCVGNEKCGFYVNGTDCPATCTVQDCGNTLYRDGTTSIQLELMLGEGTVRTIQNVKQGTQVGEYDGVLVDIEEYHVIAGKARNEKFGLISAIDYGRGGEFTVVARESGNWTRFINHSCKANLACTLRMGSNLLPSVRVVALRDIDAGETLTLDFRSQACNQGFLFECDCGRHQSGCANEGTQKPEEVESIADVLSGLNGFTETGALAVEKAAFDCVTRGEARLGEGEFSDNKKEQLVPRSCMLSAYNENSETLNQEYSKVGTSKGIVTMSEAESTREGLVSWQNKAVPTMEAGSGEQIKAEENDSQPDDAAAGSVVRTQYFICKKCKKEFRKLSYLVKHVRTHEKGRFECRECKAVFSTRRGLSGHSKLHSRGLGHLDGRKFICDTCGAGFRYKSHLGRHKLKQCENWEFGCSLCDRRFYRNDNLIRHFLQMHVQQKRSVR